MIPAPQRPATTKAVASRLITSALGGRSAIKKAQTELEAIREATLKPVPSPAPAPAPAPAIGTVQYGFLFFNIKYECGPSVFACEALWRELQDSVLIPAVFRAFVAVSVRSQALNSTLPNRVFCFLGIQGNWRSQKVVADAPAPAPAAAAAPAGTPGRAVKGRGAVKFGDTWRK